MSSYSYQLNRVFRGFQTQYPSATPNAFYGGIEFDRLKKRDEEITNEVNTIKNNITSIENNLPPVKIHWTNGSLPINPQTSDQWYNTSNGTQWFYDGTDWISFQMFDISIPGTASTQFVSPNASVVPNPITNNVRVMITPRNSVKECVVNYLLYFFATTPLDNSNYYTITCTIQVESQTPGSTSVTYTSSPLTINSNLAFTNNPHYLISFPFSGKLSVPSNGTIQLVNFIVTKVGSPGAFAILTANINYRLTAN